MKLVESILTQNPCYRDGRKITVTGLMLHSVGCPQPSAEVFIRAWNKPDYRDSCVHAIIDGRDATIYQTLPWDHRGWHCGGSGNNGYIGVEMCEPGCIKYTSGSKFTCSDFPTAQAVATRTYYAAVELFADLCEKFDLDPTGYGVILSHSEGFKRGVASGHADPEHLWQGLDLPFTMESFRLAVQEKLIRRVLDSTPAPWAKEGVEWAVANGILLGDGMGDLMLHSPVTREQVCVMLKRYHNLGK